jgi:hypothetical protein
MSVFHRIPVTNGDDTACYEFRVYTLLDGARWLTVSCSNLDLKIYHVAIKGLVRRGRYSNTDLRLLMELPNALMYIFDVDW